jgi:hypothetical protein
MYKYRNLMNASSHELARLLLYPFPTTVNIMKNKYLLAAALITLAGLGLTQRADAVGELGMTWNDGSGGSSQYLLGTVVPGTQSGGQVNRDVLMTNQLLSMTNGQTGTFIVNGDSGQYSRSFNFGSLPAAIVT